MSEQWIQQLREKMADYRRPAPEVSWEEIDRILEARQRKPVGTMLWLRRMAAAAAVLLIAGAGYWVLRQDNTVPERPIARQQKPMERQDESRTAIVDTVDEKTMPDILHPLTATTPIATLVEEPVAVDPVIAETPTDNDSVEAPTPTNEVQPQTAEHRTPDATRPTHIVYPSELRLQKHVDNRLTAKVYLSNTMNESQRAESFSQQRTEMIIYTLSRSTSTNSNDATKSIILRDTITIVNTVQTDMHVHHHQPVRFGLSLRYRLNNRWSLESGLSYTRLSSDITTQTDGKTTVDEQRLDYIGLPLNVGYQLWTSRNFGLYVTAGCTIEKMVDASPRELMDANTWESSLNMAAGAEYWLTNTFSLYAEPGVGYYFPNGSTTPTFYQDHPLNLNLSLGLRINLK